MCPEGQNKSQLFLTCDSYTHFVQQVQIFHKQIKKKWISLYQLVPIGQNDNR